MWKNQKPFTVANLLIKAMEALLSLPWGVVKKSSEEFGSAHEVPFIDLLAIKQESRILISNRDGSFHGNSKQEQTVLFSSQRIY